MKSVIVLSGGQDSVTALGLALYRKEEVEAISIDYGQRHSVELECAKELCSRYSIPHRIVGLPFLKENVTSALLQDGNVGQKHEYMADVPASFVPCRNALFLTMAYAHAMEVKAGKIITGVCQTDYSGYPDCREAFVQQLNKALDTGYLNSIQIETPMMHLTKAETFYLATATDFLEVVLNDSHTCYEGDHTTRHEWGYGCGKCPACELRAKGWEEYKRGNYDASKVESVIKGA